MYMSTVFGHNFLYSIEIVNYNTYALICKTHLFQCGLISYKQFDTGFFLYFLFDYLFIFLVLITFTNILFSLSKETMTMFLLLI